MKVGDRIRLPPTLSHPADEYRVVEIVANQVRLVSKHGARRWVSASQLQDLIERATPVKSSPVTPDSFDRDEGVLSLAGYHVGSTAGLPPVNRQIVLRRVFDMPTAVLPVGRDDSYRAEWGEASSKKRLRKMVRCLESFISMHLGRGVQYRKSIADWKADLQWIATELGAANGFKCYPMSFPPDS
jgi:hypothetical protein